MKTRITNPLAILLILLITACNSNLPEPEPNPKPITLELKAQTLVKNSNEFGLEMFRRLNNDEPENINISPLSVSLALAMTYNGACADTKTAMEKALKFEQYDTNDINQTFSDLIDALLNADNTITLDIAHSIWYKQGFNVLDTFKDINRNYYNAEVKELDFYKSNALDIINGWIEDNTGGKIRDMIKEIDPDYVMFLINAIYFKGSWKTEFEEKSTYEQAFYINPDKSVSTQMMHKTDTVAYQKNEMFSAIELPYGRGNFNMAILLPNEDSNLQTIIDSLTTDNWSLWMNSFGSKQEVNITIPRFTIDYNKQLNDVLSDMGMKIAFESTADFCGINPDADLYIDYVQHNTFIDVNEKGTEAAAATVVAMREYVAMPPTVFNANRPFLYAITEKETGTILFIGKTVNPTN